MAWDIVPEDSTGITIMAMEFPVNKNFTFLLVFAQSRASWELTGGLPLPPVVVSSSIRDIPISTTHPGLFNYV